jgi:ArsR family transcriptional regulator
MEPMVTVLTTLQTALKLLADPTRLRLCGLLARAELAVQELCSVTGLQQSRISNQLALLKRSGLVRDRREGTWSFHSLVEPREDGPLSPELFAAVLQPFLDSPEGRKDREALRAVQEQRRIRSREAHDRLAERWVEVGQEFAVGCLRAEIVAQAWPARGPVADLGCGTGFLCSYLAARGATVIAIDHSERMLQAARRGVPAGAAAEFRAGELDALPLHDGEVGAVFANLVWHHLPDLEAAAAEAFRVLAPGGVAVISDLLPHDAEWMREQMGDARLGLQPDLVVAALARVGFAGLGSETCVDRYRAVPGRVAGERVGPVRTARAGAGAVPRELPMFLVRGQKPRGSASS